MADSKFYFPMKELTKIGYNGEITLQEADDFEIELQANAAANPTVFGNGNMAYTHKTLSPAEYNLQSKIPFVEPVFPGIEPVFPANPTGPQIENAVRLHKHAMDRFTNNNKMEVVLKSQIIGCVNPVFIEALKHPTNGFRNITALHLRTHIKATYGVVTPRLLKDNYKLITGPIDFDRPIETYTNRIKRCRAIATAGGDPISDAHAIRIAIQALGDCDQYKAVLHTRAREQQNQPSGAAAETWVQFVVWLTAIDKTCREERTSSAAGFHGKANNVNVVDTVLQANAALTAQIESLLAALQANAAISAKPTKETQVADPPALKPYCWTHGICNHTSKRCTKRAEGHQEEATRKNKMGGKPGRYTALRNRTNN